MQDRLRRPITRRKLLQFAGAGAAGLGLTSLSGGLLGCGGGGKESGGSGSGSGGVYFPPPEAEGGWRIGDPNALGVNEVLLEEALHFHDENHVTTSYGGALVVIYKGHIICESYTTGAEGGPQPWKPK